jgi:hypothetical protein
MLDHYTSRFLTTIKQNSPVTRPQSGLNQASLTWRHIGLPDRPTPISLTSPISPYYTAYRRECNPVSANILYSSFSRFLDQHAQLSLVNLDILSASILDDFYEENEPRSPSSPRRPSQPSSPSRGGFLSSFTFLRDGFTNSVGSGKGGQCKIRYAD